MEKQIEIKGLSEQNGLLKKKNMELEENITKTKTSLSLEI